MTDQKPKRLAPLSVRYTLEQFALLDTLRGDLSRNAYVLWRTLQPDAPPPSAPNKNVIQDYHLISKVLGLVGQSRIANNVNQLAKAVNSGSLPVTPEVEGAIRQACQDIQEMKDALIAALPQKDKR